MTIGEFLQQALEHLYGLWPLRIIYDWEQGVRVRLGNATTLLTSTSGAFGTGLHWFLPLAGEILSEETNIETTETERQDVTCADGLAVSFSLAVRFRVRDLRLLYLKIHDREDTVLEEARSAAAEVASGAERSVVLGPTFGELVVEQMKKQTHGWGLDIMLVRPVNMTTAQQLRLIVDSSGGTE